MSLLTFGQAFSQTKQKTANMKQTEPPEHYTFKLSDKVTRQKVTFKNCYGISFVGDLYVPLTPQKKNHQSGKLCKA